MFIELSNFAYEKNWKITTDEQNTLIRFKLMRYFNTP